MATRKESLESQLTDGMELQGQGMLTFFCRRADSDTASLSSCNVHKLELRHRTVERLLGTLSVATCLIVSLAGGGLSWESCLCLALPTGQAGHRHVLPPRYS